MRTILLFELQQRELTQMLSLQETVTGDPLWSVHWKFQQQTVDLFSMAHDDEQSFTFNFLNKVHTTSTHFSLIYFCFVILSLTFNKQVLMASVITKIIKKKTHAWSVLQCEPTPIRAPTETAGAYAQSPGDSDMPSSVECTGSSNDKRRQVLFSLAHSDEQSFTSNFTK